MPHPPPQVNLLNLLRRVRALQEVLGGRTRTLPSRSGPYALRAFFILRQQLQCMAKGLRTSEAAAGLSQTVTRVTASDSGFDKEVICAASSASSYSAATPSPSRTRRGTQSQNLKTSELQLEVGEPLRTSESLNAGLPVPHSTST